MFVCQQPGLEMMPEMMYGQQGYVLCMMQVPIETSGIPVNGHWTSPHEQEADSATQWCGAGQPSAKVSTPRTSWVHSATGVSQCLNAEVPAFQPLSSGGAAPSGGCWGQGTDSSLSVDPAAPSSSSCGLRADAEEFSPPSCANSSPMDATPNNASEGTKAAHSLSAAAPVFSPGGMQYLNAEAPEFKPQSGTVSVQPLTAGTREREDLQNRELQPKWGASLKGANKLPQTPAITSDSPPAWRVRTTHGRSCNHSTFSALGLECAQPSNAVALSSGNSRGGTQGEAEVPPREWHADAESKGERRRRRRTETHDPAKASTAAGSGNREGHHSRRNHAEQLSGAKAPAQDASNQASKKEEPNPALSEDAFPTLSGGPTKTPKAPTASAWGKKLPSAVTAPLASPAPSSSSTTTPSNTKQTAHQPDSPSEKQEIANSSNFADASGKHDTQTKHNIGGSGSQSKGGSAQNSVQEPAQGFAAEPTVRVRNKVQVAPARPVPSDASTTSNCFSKQEASHAPGAWKGEQSGNTLSIPTTASSSADLQKPVADVAAPDAQPDTHVAKGAWAKKASQALFTNKRPKNVKVGASQERNRDDSDPRLQCEGENKVAARKDKLNDNADQDTEADTKHSEDLREEEKKAENNVQIQEEKAQVGGQEIAEENDERMEEQEERPEDEEDEEEKTEKTEKEEEEDEEEEEGEEEEEDEDKDHDEKGEKTDLVGGVPAAEAKEEKEADEENDDEEAEVETEAEPEEAEAEEKEDEKEEDEDEEQKQGQEQEDEEVEEEKNDPDGEPPPPSQELSFEAVDGEEEPKLERRAAQPWRPKLRVAPTAVLTVESEDTNMDRSGTTVQPHAFADEGEEAGVASRWHKKIASGGITETSTEDDCSEESPASIEHTEDSEVSYEEPLPPNTSSAAEVSTSASSPSSERGDEESPELTGSPIERMNALLTYRHLARVVPEELQTLIACSTERPRPKPLNARAEVPDRAASWTKTPSSRCGRGQGQRARTPADEQTKNAIMTPSANAYRPSSSSTKLDRDAELRRAVQGRLNKICPENVSIIAHQLGETKVETIEELQVVIGLIFKKALSEPHYCETYADLVLALKPVMPEFPSEEGGRKITFKATLLNVVQEEFESLPKVIAPTEEEAKDMDQEERDFWISQRKGRVLANMKFIGHLFLRQLLSAKIVGFVLQELTLCKEADKMPEEHVLECACELISAVGYTLEEMPMGKVALEQICGRLLDLKGKKTADKKARSFYSKRLQFAMQDILDLRQAGWAKKVFKATAKTKEEIRLEQERDELAKSRGKDVSGSERVVVGQRPAHRQDAKTR